MTRFLAEIMRWADKLRSLLKGSKEDLFAELFDDKVTIEKFREAMVIESFELLEAHIIRYEQLGKNLDKQKLFCFNCFKLTSFNKYKPSNKVAEYLEEMFRGKYDVKMSYAEAKELYNLLSFTSRIFIQERNRSIKKLFI